MNTKALVITVASLVVGVGALATLVLAAFKGIALGEIEPVLWMMVGQLGTILGVHVDSKP